MQPIAQAMSVRRTPPGHTGVRLKKLPLAAAIYLAFAPLAWGQDAPSAAPPPASTTASKDPKTLDTITVTSQKRVENLQKVPISIQVTSAYRDTRAFERVFQGRERERPQIIDNFSNAGLTDLAVTGAHPGDFDVVDGVASWAVAFAVIADSSGPAVYSSQSDVLNDT